MAETPWIASIGGIVEVGFMAIDRAFGSVQDEQMSTTSDLLERAGRLVDDGDFRSAIALLEKAGSSHDPALAQRLIDLRIQAYANIDWPAPHSNWPPFYGRYCGRLRLPGLHDSWPQPLRHSDSAGRSASFASRPARSSARSSLQPSGPPSGSPRSRSRDE